MRSVSLYLTWTLVGFIASFGVLYGFTPFGPGIAAVLVLAVLLVPRIEGKRSPEAWGLLLGWGVFWTFVGTTVDGDPVPFYVFGAASALVATAWYVTAGRTRCLRNS